MTGTIVIYPCCTRTDGALQYVERCEASKAEFWGIYERVKDDAGTSETWIEDKPTEEEAHARALELTKETHPWWRLY